MPLALFLTDGLPSRKPHSVNVPKRTFTPFGLLRLQNPQQRPPNSASSNEQPSEPARIVDVERQKYLTPNKYPKRSADPLPVHPGCHELERHDEPFREYSPEIRARRTSSSTVTLQRGTETITASGG